jgi:hypothetical protein
MGREAERSGLRRRLTLGRPLITLLYGRRCVGKTHFLKHVWPQNITFLLTASNTSPEQNRLQRVLQAIGAVYKELNSIGQQTRRLCGSRHHRSAGRPVHTVSATSLLKLCLNR